jgi:hypothetical protein
MPLGLLEKRGVLRYREQRSKATLGPKSKIKAQKGPIPPILQ